MPRLVPTLLLAALLLPLTVHAEAPVAFESAAPRVGDRLAYRAWTSVTGGDPTRPSPFAAVYDPGEATVLVEVKGPAVVLDAFGLDAQVVLVEQTRFTAPDAVREALRCAIWPGTGTGPRTDHLAGGPRYAEEWTADYGVLGGQRHYTNFSYVTTYGASCDVEDHTVRVDADVARWGGPPFREPRNFPEFTGATTPSAARVVDFHGRRAVELSYPLTNARLGETFDSERGRERPQVEGLLTVTLAEGIPGYARIAIHEERTLFGSTRVSDGTYEVIGYEPGQSPLPVADRSTLPLDSATRNPRAAFASADSRHVPDEALGLPYPYREALAALLDDRTVRLREWLDAHPRAGLEEALYDRHMHRGSEAGAGASWEGDGGWYLRFGDGTSAFSVQTVRVSGVSGPASLALPGKRVLNTMATESSTTFPPANRTLSLLSRGDVARLVELSGIAPGTVEGVSYFAGASPFGGDVAQMRVSQVAPWTSQRGGSHEGLVASIDLMLGRLEHVGTTTQASTGAGLIAALPGGVQAEDEPRAAALGALVGSLPGLRASVGAAATGVALAVLFAKFVLVPLFTRLVRSRLLDHPVRARLHERVRAEPAIRLAELVEVAGLSRSATKRHLDQLVRHRFLVELEEGGATRYYAAGDVPPDAARHAAALRAGSARDVYELYAREPDLTLREAAARLGMRAPSVHRAKKRLEREGLLPPRPDAEGSLARLVPR